jgi:hypothetical protein
MRKWCQNCKSSPVKGVMDMTGEDEESEDEFLSFGGTELDSFRS